MMVRGGFQEEDEARAKWLRARLTSTQLSHLLPRRAGDVGHGGRGAARAAVAPVPARTAVPPQRDRRWLGRDARLRLSDPPRIGHLPRHAADQVGPPRLSRRQYGLERGLGLILPSYREGAVVEAIDARRGDRRPPRLALRLHDRSPAGRAVGKRSEDYFNDLRRARHRRPRGCEAADSARRASASSSCRCATPLQLAKELATLDALSGGRLIVGVGVGWNATEFGYVGAGRPVRRRGAYLDEAIEMWRDLWRGDQGRSMVGSTTSTRSASAVAAAGSRAADLGRRTDERALKRAGRLGQWLSLVGVEPVVSTSRACRSSATRPRKPVGRADHLGTLPGRVRPTRRAVLHARRHAGADGRRRSASSRRSASRTWRSTSPRRTAERCRDLIERFDKEVARRIPMSESDSGSAPRRPATARPRSDDEHEGMAPPSRDELEAIEQHRLDWTFTKARRSSTSRILALPSSATRIQESR